MCGTPGGSPWFGVHPGGGARGAAVEAEQGVGDIATARQLIASRGFLFAFALVTKDSDGINREVVAAGEPVWSWHLQEFPGIGTAAIELRDGTPTFTERESQGWPDHHVVEIYQWEYTVVDELGPLPVESTS